MISLHHPWLLLVAAGLYAAEQCTRQPFLCFEVVVWSAQVTGPRSNLLGGQRDGNGTSQDVERWVLLQQQLSRSSVNQAD